MKHLSIVKNIADQQHGVIARHQLLDQGCPTSAIQRMVRSQLLCRIGRGVYITFEMKVPGTTMRQLLCSYLATSPIFHMTPCWCTSDCWNQNDMFDRTVVPIMKLVPSMYLQTTV